MTEHDWIPKSDLATFFGVSERTIQRKIQALDPRLVKREGKRVLVSREAVNRGVFGKTQVQLAEEVEILQSSVSALNDDNERLRVQLEHQRLQATIESQQREIEALRQQLEETADQRDIAFDAMSALTTRLASGGSRS